MQFAYLVEEELRLFLAYDFRQGSADLMFAAGVSCDGSVNPAIRRIRLPAFLPEMKFSMLYED